MCGLQRTDPMQRFRPYFKYLRRVRATLVAGVLCGILYGVAGGLCMPLMVKYVIPRVLLPDPAPVHNAATKAPRFFDLDRFFDRLLPPAPTQPAAETLAAHPPAQAAASRPQLTAWQVWTIAMWLPLVFAIRGVAGYLNTRSEERRVGKEGRSRGA